MQIDTVLLARYARTCLRLCQAQQQTRTPSYKQQMPLLSQWGKQHNQLRAAATLALTAVTANLTDASVVSRTRQHYRHIHQQQSQNYQVTTALRGKFSTDTIHEPLCSERARELICNLKDSEREAIKQALLKYDAELQRAGFEGKLAATQWRTRFGRPSKVPRLGDVDPTGSFCTFPENWLTQKAAATAPKPAMRDLRRIVVVNAVPFIAFGFLDNFVMILAGDSIECIFGSFMCMSTMAAAGLGNTVSDILGIGSAYYVERGCEMIGLRLPDLTPVQMEMKSSRQASNFGRIVGITIGCLLGMSPLLFMKKDEPAAAKLEAGNVKAGPT